jgi:signal transduction histidine kinase
MRTRPHLAGTDAFPDSRAGSDERPTWLDEPFDLLRYFTVWALVVVLIATLGVAGVSAWVVQRSFLHIEKDEADSLAEDMTMDLGLFGYDRGRWGSGTVPAGLRDGIERQMGNFGIDEFTLFSLDGRILEEFAAPSAEARTPWREGLQQAAAGETVLRWETGRELPIPWVRGKSRGDVETYTPVRDRGKVVSVARVRRNPSPNLLRAEGSLPLVVGIALAFGTTVFGALWFLVRKADRVLKWQHLELVSVQDHLALQNRQLAELSRRKDEFYAMCSHDLRTPLVSVEAGCRLLLEADLASAIRQEIAEENLRNASVVLDLVNNLLELARVEEQGESLETADLDLASLVEGVVAANRAFAASRGVALDVEAPSGEVVVAGDRLKLVRILNNLVSNAIKHAEGKPVSVVLERGASDVRLLVRDRGPGLRPEIRADLLEGRDFSTGRTGVPGGEVHGLGLAIVRRLVDLHGGSLDVRTGREAGTTFVVTLPAA